LEQTAEDDLMHRYQFSVARADFKSVYDKAERGGVAVILRRGSDPVALLRRDEMDSLLAERFPLEAEVSFSDAGVSMWVPVLPVHGEGADLDEAAGQLVDALFDYADLWASDLCHAPNHEANLGWVRRVQLYAGEPESLRNVLLGSA